MKVEEEVYEVDKQTVYDYKGDTIFINSDYRATSDYRFLRKVQGKYVFDQLGRLKEVMTVLLKQMIVCLVVILIIIMIITLTIRRI